MGLHIRTLIARFLMVYCQPLVEDGRLYIGLSPLYNVDKGKKSWSYFIDRDDFVKYVRDQFFKNNTIFHYNKKEFTKTELLSLIENNRFYRDMLKSIGENNAIHPILLEDILIFRNEPFNKIKSLIEKKYQYLKVKKENGGFVVDGVAFDRTCTVVVNSYLITSCQNIIHFLDRSEKRYIVNGRIVGLYELLDLYSESEPKNIERAKGLGALSPFELGKSTLDPNNRKLMRYTVEDIIKEIEEMRKINDDKYSLIKDLDLSQFEF